MGNTCQVVTSEILVVHIASYWNVAGTIICTYVGDKRDNQKYLNCINFDTCLKVLGISYQLQFTVIA